MLTSLPFSPPPELVQALTIARDTAAFICASLDTIPLDVEEKPDDMGPVTALDKAANQRIVAALEASFPGDVIVAEESNTGPMSAPRLWLVDPIDGTKSLISGSTEYSVMIGLVRDGRPWLGVVLRPQTQELCFALRGHGAWTERAAGYAPLRVSTCGRPEDARAVVSRSHPSEEVDGLYQQLGVHQRRPLSSIGLKMIEIAKGAAEVYLNVSGKTAQWDTAAPEIILTEAGGQVSDRHGAPLRYDGRDLQQSSGVVATNGPLHQGLLEALARGGRG